MNTEDNFQNWLFPDGFSGLRNGLREHIDNHRFTISDAATYLYLQMHARWTTGICFTCAPVIADKFEAPLKTINDSLARMRVRGYINYPKGDGSRGCYPILIHKARPTVGELLGYELDAFASNDFDKVIYLRPDGHRVEAAWKPRAAQTEAALMTSGSRVLTACIQDLKTYKTEQTGKKKQDHTKKEEVPPSAGPPSPPQGGSSGFSGQAGRAPELEIDSPDPETLEAEPETSAPGSDPEAVKLAQEFWAWLPDSPAYCKTWTTRWASQIKSKPEAVAYVRQVLHYAATQNQFFITGLKACLRRKEDPMSYLLDDKYQNIMSSMTVDEDKKKQNKKSGSNKEPIYAGFEYREKQVEI